MPNNLPYDLVFIGVAAVMLLARLLLLWATGSPKAARKEPFVNWRSAAGREDAANSELVAWTRRYSSLGPREHATGRRGGLIAS